MPAVKKLVNIPELVDNLGRVKADIAELEKKEKKAVDTIKAQGVNLYCGKLFEANVFTQERGKSTDWEAVAKALNAGKKLIAQYTVTRTVVDINWEAIAQEMEPDPELVKKHTTCQEVTVCKVTARS